MTTEDVKILERAKAVTEVPTPEHDKRRLILDQSQTIGQFIEDMQGKDMWFCESRDSEVWPYMPTTKTIEQILADYFDIDLVKIEEERRAILAAIQTDGGKI